MHKTQVKEGHITPRGMLTALNHLPIHGVKPGEIAVLHNFLRRKSAWLIEDSQPGLALRRPGRVRIACDKIIEVRQRPGRIIVRAGWIGIHKAEVEQRHVTSYRLCTLLQGVRIGSPKPGVITIFYELLG